MSQRERILKEKLVDACRFIENSSSVPTLKEVAGHVQLSPTYLQKQFSIALGVSPRQYADAVRFHRLRSQLKEGHDISYALYEAGFGSNSRLYEFAHRYLGMTPRSYQNKGKGEHIMYTITNSPLGYLLLAATSRGLCSVRFGENKAKLLRELQLEFSDAQVEQKGRDLESWTQSLVDYLAGKKPWPLLPYDVQATAFQRKVWDYLRTIPAGQTYDYSSVAKAIGRPKAARAVARACASNRLALVIPCHRIVPKSGGVGGYRWQPKRKQRLLELEKRS